MSIIIPWDLARRTQVGDDILASAVLPGYLVLIEAREVDGYLVGDGPEVAAVVTRSGPSEDGLFREISWVGAVPGRDAPRQGISFYDPGARVTVLSRSLAGVQAA